MTLTLELPAEVENSLREAAAREGVALDVLLLDALRERAARDGNATIAARLAALDALPTTNNRGGLPQLDLSGERADVYGYTEREDEQL